MIGFPSSQQQSSVETACKYPSAIIDCTEEIFHKFHNVPNWITLVSFTGIDSKHLLNTISGFILNIALGFYTRDFIDYATH